MNSKTILETATNQECYQRRSREVIFATSFLLSGGKRLLAPFSYLSHVEMISANELLFTYTFGEVRVKGEGLGVIYDIAHVHELNAVGSIGPGDAPPSGARVEGIEFIRSADAQDA